MPLSLVIEISNANRRRRTSSRRWRHGLTAEKAALYGRAAYSGKETYRRFEVIRHLIMTATDRKVSGERYLVSGKTGDANSGIMNN